MKKLLYPFLLLIMLLAVGSCEKQDPESLAQKEIRDILYDISSDFNISDMAGIIDHLHDDYLHNGMRQYQFNSLWLERKSLYSLLQIEVLFIDFMDNKAIAHTTNTFTSSTAPTLVNNEPEDNGDISYFVRSNGVWLLYGNQQLSKQ